MHHVCEQRRPLCPRPWMLWDTITLRHKEPVLLFVRPVFNVMSSLFFFSNEYATLTTGWRVKYWHHCCDFWSVAHRLWLLHIIFPYGGHELQMFVLLLQCDHLLVLVLEALLCTGQLVSQPLVLLTKAPHLSMKLKKESGQKMKGQKIKQDKWLVVFSLLWEIFTWARSFCFSASSEPKCADNANITWSNDQNRRK